MTILQVEKNGIDMKKYHGSCHCGKVKFEIEANIDKVIECNCSICKKKGVLLFRVSPENFALITGEESLTLYQFGTMKAKHFFCKTCGIQVFTNPRLAPDNFAINARCLDDFSLNGIEIIHFDGQNWEESAKKLGLSK